MKAKSLTFRPTTDHRSRLERLTAATKHKITQHVEWCIEAHLPALEKRYARELADLERQPNETSAAPTKYPAPKSRSFTMNEKKKP